MAPSSPVKVLINHASRCAVMGPSSQGNELIYYQALSAGRPSRLLGKAPDARAQHTFNLGTISRNALVSHRPLAARKGGRCSVERPVAQAGGGGLDGVDLHVVLQVGLPSGTPCTHLTHEVRVT